LRKNRAPLPERILANWPAKALSLAAAIMLFLFHNFSTLAERRLSVDLNVRFSDGLTAAQTYPRKVWVTVRGPEQSISAAQAADLEATADFSRFTVEGIHKAPVLVRKKGALETMDPLEIHVEPMELALTLERKGRKLVDVIPSFKGAPSADYGLGNYVLTPDKVEVVGPLSEIDDIFSVETEEIELSGKREDFTVKVKLKKGHPLMAFSNGDVVEFRGQIMETLMTKMLGDRSIRVRGLPPNLRLSDALPPGSLWIQGGRAALDILRPEQVGLVVDCSGIALPGVYTLPVRSEAPPGILVTRFDPVQVTLDVRPGGR